MPSCDMCGYAGTLCRVIIEGSMLNVCPRCIGYGNAVEIKQPNKEEVRQKLTFRTKSNFSKSYGVEDDIIVSDYSVRVKKSRLKLGKTQDDVAKAIAEKVSVLQKVELGSLEPPLKLAKKLEQFFKIKLIKKQEKVSKEVVKEFDLTEGALTIGDLIKMKRK